MCTHVCMCTHTAIDSEVFCHFRGVPSSPHSLHVFQSGGLFFYPHTLPEYSYLPGFCSGKHGQFCMFHYVETGLEGKLS